MPDTWDTVSAGSIWDPWPPEPPVPGSSAEPQPRRPARTIERCVSCGQRAYVRGTSTDTSEHRCTRCARRYSDSVRAQRRGGRRFGVEIEVEFPNAEYPHNYGYDDDMMPADRDYDAAADDPELGFDNGGACNCTDCRAYRIASARRAREVLAPRPTREVMPTAEQLAARITEAGVPCVTIGYSHEVLDDEWKVTSDGSLNCGWEIVSPPMQWRNADQIRTVCRVLREVGAEPTVSCGLHVHHDVADIDVEGMRRLLSNWHAWQPFTDRLVDPTRVNGGAGAANWCAPYDQRQVQYLCGQDTLSSMLYDVDRYQSLNISCFLNYGTVEIRQHESTLDADEILAWIAYGQAIIHASINDMDLPEAASVAGLVDTLPIRASRAMPSRAAREKLKRKADVTRQWYGTRC